MNTIMHSEVFGYYWLIAAIVAVLLMPNRTRQPSITIAWWMAFSLIGGGVIWPIVLYNRIKTYRSTVR